MVCSQSNIRRSSKKVAFEVIRKRIRKQCSQIPTFKNSIPLKMSLKIGNFKLLYHWQYIMVKIGPFCHFGIYSELATLAKKVFCYCSERPNLIREKCNSCTLNRNNIQLLWQYTGYSRSISPSIVIDIVLLLGKYSSNTLYFKNGFGLLA